MTATAEQNWSYLDPSTFRLVAQARFISEPVCQWTALLIVFMKLSKKRTQSPVREETLGPANGRCRTWDRRLRAAEDEPLSRTVSNAGMRVDSRNWGLRTLEFQWWTRVYLTAFAVRPSVHARSRLSVNSRWHHNVRDISFRPPKRPDQEWLAYVAIDVAPLLARLSLHQRNQFHGSNKDDGPC